MTSLPDWALRARSGWTFRGQERPPFAIEPEPDQESVWDYPRPPRLERDSRAVLVRAGDVIIAESARAIRLLETASPPSFYLPPADVNRGMLEPGPGSSACEWKGMASYWSVRGGSEIFASSAWSYPNPLPDFELIRDHFAFYPNRFDCFVDGEQVRPQPGGFYGGWVTSEIVGPMKGEPGTRGW